MAERNKKEISIPSYSLEEELFNAISHGLGALLSVAALVLMLIRARNALEVTTAAIFGTSMIFLYTIPNLEAPETPQIGVWGRQYLHHLRTERRVLYTQLFFSGKLNAHLEEVARHAEELMDRLVAQMAAAEGVTEQLKAENQMEWVRCMNSIRSRAEEIVFTEFISP